MNEQRQRKAIAQKDSHISYAVIERSAFEMVTEFYRMLNVFHESTDKDDFLNMLAGFLNKRKFSKIETRDFTHLNLKSRKLAETVLSLLNEPQDSTLEWKILVKQLIQRVQDYVINDFALNFCTLASEMILDSGITSDLAAANRIKELSEKQSDELCMLLESALRFSSARKMQEIQENIKLAFVAQKPAWESYLDLSGRGILRYLSDISKIDFNPKEVDRFIPAGNTGKLKTGII